MSTLPHAFIINIGKLKHARIASSMRCGYLHTGHTDDMMASVWDDIETMDLCRLCCRCCVCATWRDISICVVRAGVCVGEQCAMCMCTTKPVDYEEITFCNFKRSSSVFTSCLACARARLQMLKRPCELTSLIASTTSITRLRVCMYRHTTRRRRRTRALAPSRSQRSRRAHEKSMK